MLEEEIRTSDHKSIIRSVFIYFGLLGILTITSGIFFRYYYGHDIFLDKGFLTTYIGSIIIVISAILAGYLTVLELTQHRNEARKDRASATRTNERTSRRRATLDLITNTELDKEFIEARSVYQKYANKQNGEMAQLFARTDYCIKNDRDPVDNYKDLLNIATFFNSFEIVSLAIKNEILDEKFYMEWQGTSFVDVWNRSAETIGVLRSIKHPKVYEHWEAQATKWARELGKDIIHPKQRSLNELAQLINLELKDTANGASHNSQQSG